MGSQKLKWEPSPATHSLCDLWQVLEHPSAPGYEMEMIPMFQPCPSGSSGGLNEVKHALQV